MVYLGSNIKKSSLPALGFMEFRAVSRVLILKYALKRDLYSVALPPKGGPDSVKGKLNNSPASLPLGFRSCFILFTYAGLKPGSNAQKKVCSRIRSKLFNARSKSCLQEFGVQENTAFFFLCFPKAVLQCQ